VGKKDKHTLNSRTIPSLVVSRRVESVARARLKVFIDFLFDFAVVERESEGVGCLSNSAQADTPP
jgi:hypothetical protein